MAKSSTGAGFQRLSVCGARQCLSLPLQKSASMFCAVCGKLRLQIMFRILEATYANPY